MHELVTWPPQKHLKPAIMKSKPYVDLVPLLTVAAAYELKRFWPGPTRSSSEFLPSSNAVQAESRPHLAKPRKKNDREGDDRGN